MRLSRSVEICHMGRISTPACGCGRAPEGAETCIPARGSSPRAPRSPAARFWHYRVYRVAISERVLPSAQECPCGLSVWGAGAPLGPPGTPGRAGLSRHGMLW